MLIYWTYYQYYIQLLLYPCVHTFVVITTFLSDYNNYLLFLTISNFIHFWYLAIYQPEYNTLLYEMFSSIQFLSGVSQKQVFNFTCKHANSMLARWFIFSTSTNFHLLLHFFCCQSFGGITFETWLWIW